MERRATRAVRPQRDAAVAGLGLAGGALAGLAALAMLVASHVALAPGGLAAVRAFDHRAIRAAALAPVNAVGAWLVRWLQVADPTALELPYVDALAAGVVTPVILGALAGAVIAAAGERFPDDAPLAWSAVAAVGLWIVARFAVAPALDPVLLRAVDGRALFAAHVAFGLALGAWVSAARSAAGSGSRRAADGP